MSKVLEELVVEIRTDQKKLKREMSQLQNGMKKQGSKLGGLFGGSFKTAFLAGGVVGLILSFKKALDFANIAKDAARDANEMASKYITVFSSIRRDAKKTSKSFAKEFGIANSTAKELLGSTGDLLVGFGFTEKKALSLSKEVNSLAQDLASFTNYSGGAKGASEALTKAILGETESAKSLGIVIRQNTKEFRDEVSQIAEDRGMTQQQAKAVVILKQAYEQSGKAVGDYARTKDSLANVERKTLEQTKELLETIGRGLIPAYKTFNSLLSGALSLLLPVKNAIKDEALEVNKLVIQLSNAKTPQEDRVRLLKELREINPDVVRGINSESIAVATLATNLREYNSQLIQRLVIQKQQDKISEKASEAAEAQIKLTELKTKAEETLAKALIERTEREAKYRDTRGGDRLTAELKRFNEILASNLTIEEKISKLQQEKIIGQLTNYWNDLSRDIKGAKENLRGYKEEFDALTGKQLVLSSAPKIEPFDIPTEEMDDIDLGDVFVFKLGDYGKAKIKKLGYDMQEYLSKQTFEATDPISDDWFRIYESMHKDNIMLEEQKSLWVDLGQAQAVAMGNLVSGWTSTISLFKEANSMLEQFLNTLVQVGLQQVAIQAIGSFASGDAGGSGLLGIIGGAFEKSNNGNSAQLDKLTSAVKAQTAVLEAKEFSSNTNVNLDGMAMVKSLEKKQNYLSQTGRSSK